MIYEAFDFRHVTQRLERRCFRVVYCMNSKQRLGRTPTGNYIGASGRLGLLEVFVALQGIAMLQALAREFTRYPEARDCAYIIQVTLEFSICSFVVRSTAQVLVQCKRIQSCFAKRSVVCDEA